VSNAAVTVCTRTSVQVSALDPVGVHLGMESLAHVTAICLPFKKLPVLQLAVPGYISTSNEWVSIGGGTIIIIII
jgi:hypothetical protein